MKISIFVEGYTELAFVRELLLRFYEYQNIDIICQEIRGGEYLGVNYDYPNSNDFYDTDNGRDKFLIVDCGGDHLSSKILKREKHLLEQNFERIIGLRDVYSLEFRQNISKIFDRKLVENFIKFNQEIIQTDSTSDCVFLCMAIMEIESWYLGMTEIFSKKHELLTSAKIIELCGNADPEEQFKPSSKMEEAYVIAKDEYKKRGTQADSLSNYPEKDDYRNLYNSNYCNSFNHFCDTVGLVFN